MNATQSNVGHYTGAPLPAKAFTSLRQMEDTYKATKDPGISSLIKRNNSFKMDVTLLTYNEKADLRLRFNPQYYDSEEVSTIIEGIKNSYIDGRTVEPIQVSLMDGKPTVVGGFKKYRAALAAYREIEPGTEFLVPVQEVSSDLEHILVTTLSTENRHQMNKVEFGTIFRSMMIKGKSVQEICALGFKESFVRTCIATLTFPKEAQELIIHGKMSVSQWRKLEIEYSEFAVEVALAAANSHGKVTDKHVASVAKRAVSSPAVQKESARVLRHILQNVDGDSVTLDAEKGALIALPLPLYQELMQLKQLMQI